MGGRRPYISKIQIGGLLCSSTMLIEAPFVRCRIIQNARKLQVYPFQDRTKQGLHYILGSPSPSFGYSSFLTLSLTLAKCSPNQVLLPFTFPCFSGSSPLPSSPTHSPSTALASSSIASANSSRASMSSFGSSIRDTSSSEEMVRAEAV